MIKKSDKYKKVMISKVQDFDNMYLTTSWRDKGNPITAIHIVKNNYFVEWETSYGPIAVIKKAEEPYNKEDEERYGEVIDNYFFEKTYGRGSWTQLAVIELNLHEDLNKGDFKSIHDKLSAYLPQ